MFCSSMAKKICSVDSSLLSLLQVGSSGFAFFLGAQNLQSLFHIGVTFGSSNDSLQALKLLLAQVGLLFKEERLQLVRTGHEGVGVRKLCLASRRYCATLSSRR